MKKRLFFSVCVLFVLGASAQTPKPLTITQNTHFVFLPNDCEGISWIEDGVWSVERYNKYAFYNDEGQQIFDFDWEAGAGFRTPQMVSGAVPMYKKGETNSQKPMWLLYRDGSSKELPADYIGPATNFVDGVALIGKKKSSGYGVEYVYINPEGQRVFGTLVSNPERFENTNWTVPPLREGLRAFLQLNSSGYGGKWGYIDAAGKVVIPARFDHCRSFSEGYALVQEDRDIYFIDKKGNKAIAPMWEDDTYFNDISDVHDGYFVVNYNPRKYYNTKGVMVQKLPEGSAFYNGYCFAEDEEPFNGKSRVFDKDFKLVRKIKEVDLWWNDEGRAPIFTQAGVATVNRDRVIAPDGTTLIMHYPVTKKSPNKNGIEYFSPSGYAKAWLMNNGQTYEGFINLEGEFVIIYRWNRDVSPIVCDPNNPCVCDTCRIIPEPIPPLPPIPPHPMVYNVTVVAAPSDGGTVSGGGKYHLGDKVPLKASPKEGWKLYKWECKTPGYYNSNLPEGVVINGSDLAFVATFLPEVKEDPIDKVGSTGSYSAPQTMLYNNSVNVDFEVYMEMSVDKNIESPYGKETYGFLTCVFDPNKVITEPLKVNGKESTVSSKIFFVPMKISGIIKEDGKQYMVLDGGQYMVSDMTLSGEVPSAALFFNMLMGSEGTLGTVSDGRYRLEMTEYNPETGECTFGELYRFHPDFGWMKTDEYPTKTVNTFFGSKTYKTTIDGKFFRGVKMKACPKRSVDFVPPQGWVKEGYESGVSNLLQQMESLTTDWEIYFGK